MTLKFSTIYTEAEAQLCTFGLVLCTLVSCVHKELSLPEEDRVAVTITVDWGIFDEDEIPSGMTVIIYDEEGTDPTYVETNDVSQTSTTLEPGTYHIVVIDYSTGEFETLKFIDLDDFNNARVSVLPTESDWYVPAEGEEVAVEPEDFALDISYDITIGGADADNVSTNIVTHLNPEIAVGEVQVQIQVAGVHRIREVRGAISGMAGSYLIAVRHTGTDRVTHLLNSWISTRAATEDEDLGWITTTFSTFGLPYNHVGESNENILTLSFVLTDYSTYSCQLPVGDLFEPLEDLNYQLTVPTIIELPEVEESPDDGNSSDNSSSAFDPSVSDWGTEEDLDFNL